MKKSVTILLILLGGIVALAIAYKVVDSFLFDGIRPELIREDDLQGKFYSQKEVQHKPAIILVGGGYWGEYWGQVFAKKGFVALSLPYCMQEGLPDKVEEIPLEYIGNAIDWLEEDLSISPNKIILMGASRNAELALMTAAYFPEKVDGVIAYAPGSVHWSNTVMPFNSDEVKPSWTLGGKPLPYAKMDKYKPGADGKIDFLSYWEKGLADSLQIAQASIPVENINGPIFLFSGKDDKVWPSTKMSDMIEQRLNTHNFAHPVHNIQYDNSGHLISSDPDSKNHVNTSQISIDGKSYEYELGGTAEGEIYAKQDARKRIFEYLETIRNSSP